MCFSSAHRRLLKERRGGGGEGKGKRDFEVTLGCGAVFNVLYVVNMVGLYLAEGGGAGKKNRGREFHRSF